MKRIPIYLDYNATTPCDQRVIAAMLPFFTNHFGNAASVDHWYGWQARDAVEEARSQVAKLIGAKSNQLIFTSGATEAINLALKGVVEARTSAASHIITSRAEHKAVLDTCSYLESKGCRISWLDVNSEGQISIQQLQETISPDTGCVALMYANNETGVITPVKEVSAITRKYQVPFFCDATQAVGKIPLNVQEDGIDMLACSSHKIYGPKGVGALYLRDKKLIASQQHGGEQEGGYRSGTLNTAGIVGFGKAAELCSREMWEDSTRLGLLRDQLEQYLLEHVPGIVVNGGEERLSHVSNLLVPNTDTEQLLLSLSSFLALSRGSACSGLLQRPSHVLTAMGVKEEDAYRALRISLGRFTTKEDVTEAAERLVQALLTKAPTISLGNRSQHA